jgi:hypothetical protein
MPLDGPPASHPLIHSHPHAADPPARYGRRYPSHAYARSARGPCPRPATSSRSHRLHTATPPSSAASIRPAVPRLRRAPVRRVARAHAEEKQGLQVLRQLSTARAPPRGCPRRESSTALGRKRLRHGRARGRADAPPGRAPDIPAENVRNSAYAGYVYCMAPLPSMRDGPGQHGGGRFAGHLLTGSGGETLKL